AGEHHENTVRQRAHLVQLDRNQKYSLSGISRLDNAPVDELDRADIDTARGLPDDQELRIPLDLPRHHDLLLVAAGEIRRLQARIGGADIVFGDLLLGIPADRVEIEKGTTPVLRIAVIAE